MKKLSLFLIALLFLVGCETSSPSNNETAKINNEPAKMNTEKKHDFAELTFEVLKKSEGTSAKPGDSLLMHYSGYLEDGTKFDSSIDRGEPFSFSLGAGQVIRGWDEGIVDMNIGERRKLYIPYSYGYGDMGFPPVIPQKANLIFEIELVDILSKE